MNGKHHSTSQGPESSLNFLLFHFFILINHLAHAEYDRTMECSYLCGWQLYSPQWGIIHLLLLNKQYLMKVWLHAAGEARFNHWPQDRNSSLTANFSQPIVKIKVDAKLFLYMPWKHMEGRRHIVPLIFNLSTSRRWGHAVVELVEALRYKPEGCGFDSRWCHWNFSLTQSFWPHYGPGVDSASNRNEYQEYFLGGKGSRCIRLTTLPPSCADCLEIWEPQPPGTLKACPGL